MILASRSGLLCACRLVKDNPKSWVINYNDKAFPKDQRIPKDGNRMLFDTVDKALEWIGD